MSIEQKVLNKTVGFKLSINTENDESVIDLGPLIKFVVQTTIEEVTKARHKFTNEDVLELAKKAGFILWSDGERKGKIDWACEYDEDMVKFANIVAKKVLQDVSKG